MITTLLRLRAAFAVDTQSCSCGAYCYPTGRSPAWKRTQRVIVRQVNGVAFFFICLQVSAHTAWHTLALSTALALQTSHPHSWVQILFRHSQSCSSVCAANYRASSVATTLRLASLSICSVDTSSGRCNKQPVCVCVCTHKSLLLSWMKLPWSELWWEIHKVIFRYIGDHEAVISGIVFDSTHNNITVC